MVDVVKLLEPVSRIRHRRTAPLVLELDLTEELAEEVPGDPLGQFVAMRRQRLSDVVEGLRRAERDPRVKALVARIGSRPLGFGRVQELREAIARFRRSGKPTVAWSESFGDFGPGTVPYYLASAFEEIVLLPSGTVGLTGLSLTTRFVREATDKIGVEYEVSARHEYKTALNTFTERGFTEAHREASSRIVESLSEQVVQAVAEGRGLDVEEVRSLVGRGPFLAAEALDAGLVDRLGYRDEIYAELLGRFRGSLSGAGSEPAHLQFVSRYQRMQSLAGRVPAVQRGDQVALVTGIGQIEPGRSRRSPLGGLTMGSDTVAAALRAARRDPHVRAVVFRVDSPGGSYVASDIIRREVRLTEEAGKPVVVSMGDFAASGGYFVAVGAGTIVAQPGTLTGSIGVFMGKVVLSELLRRVGVASDSVDYGAHAGMFGSDHRFSASEWERVNAMLDHIYDDFTAKVAEARGKSREEVHELARGRVWTGADAAAHGLVDELGGIETAARLARERAGLPSTTPLRPFPRPNPLERLVPAESSEDRGAAVTRIRLGSWGPLAGVSALLGLPAAGPLVLPGTWEIR
ncbi:signal peptide peptidase A. Serine peptidase. MEROPS family S49 [Marinactinospora thermotolerans DSM 45154]|uniref:Signal peptide peptidase A. Serine peptidase. MEROPS family S49 n=1 Tax=Marinactinospora thermotolerans DSM 45154 TaxID=1122192 RepID=A0A1T4SE86_9ACTN|nr:signal peptide peptidase SppA [Marinactinospora thermotolerans]SKA26477.1 signal peptide peptidase A. Serine peptidase. MEROPS family S49 [Marinactinospora thermotolerans DSM 45154]